jgi:hypothetical protein
MLMVMDMTTGKIEEPVPEFGSFEDEVLNAEWLPQPQVQLGLQPVVAHPHETPAVDAEAFLRSVYMNQE